MSVSRPNLTIHFNHREDELYYIDSYFDNCYEKSWFESDLARRIMKEIDRVFEVNGEVFTAKHFCDGKDVTLAPSQLSSGTKVLLTLLNTDEPFVCFSRCGDNGVPFLFEIAKIKPISITLNNCIVLNGDFDFYCDNDNTIYHSAFDFLRLVLKYTG